MDLTLSRPSRTATTFSEFGAVTVGHATAL
jgi:hypothetical protein